MATFLVQGVLAARYLRPGIFTDRQPHLPNNAVLAGSNFSLASYTGLRKDLPLSQNNKVYSHSCSGISKKHSVVVVSAAAKSLNQLPFWSFINKHGRIQPIMDPNTLASVVAVFDRNRRIQYIGFSKDLRNSLRTLMGRRTELCYFYKVHNLNAFDQEVMLSIRDQWISEIGSIPPGNANPSDRVLWEQPATADAISERGRAAAAVSKAKTLQQMFRDRGIKEEMIFDPVLLEQGKLNLLPSKDLSPEELARSAVAQAQAGAKRKNVSVPVPSGGVIEYDIVYEMKFKTNGGWMYDVAVTYDDKETKHRIIVGKIFSEAADMAEDDFLEVVVAFLLRKDIPRHTEGILSPSEFNINYFSIGEVSVRFKDLQEWFSKELPEDEWGFVNVESYGAEIDPPPVTGPLELSEHIKSPYSPTL